MLITGPRDRPPRTDYGPNFRGLYTATKPNKNNYVYSHKIVATEIINGTNIQII